MTFLFYFWGSININFFKRKQKIVNELVSRLSANMNASQLSCLKMFFPLSVSHFTGDIASLYVYEQPLSNHVKFFIFFKGKDGSKVTTVVATPGQGPDRPQEVSYSDTKVIGNGSFGVVFQAKLCDTGELVAIKKVLQDKRFKVNYQV